MKLTRVWFFLLAAATVALAAPAPSDEGVPLNIDVRSKVDAKWEGFRKLRKVAHGKVYFLAAVNEVEVYDKLVKPVDRAVLAEQLRQTMATKGYREISNAQEIPDIVLTVKFGRGFLHNPYFEDVMVDESSGAPTLSISTPNYVIRQRQFDGEGKLQRAQEEKLYIAVTAWQYPSAKGEKPNLLWRTVMVTDNPDSRDLNLAIPAMLTAGVGYFDQDIKDGEVRINTTMPTGTVKLGPLEVIEEVKSRGR